MGQLLRWCACLLVASVAVLHAQTVAAPATLNAALQTMSAGAEVIFAGEVKAIRHLSGVVEVDWLVEEPVCGVAAGATFTEREWRGLWEDGDRYVVGQRSMVLLHGASSAGLRSPVQGAKSVIPIRGDALTGTADLRWIATGVARAIQDAKGGVVTVRALAATDAVEDAPPPNLQTMSRSIVLSQMSAWHGAMDTAR